MIAALNQAVTKRFVIRPTDGRGYDATDRPEPANPYGASKLAGERAAIDAFGDQLLALAFEERRAHRGASSDRNSSNLPDALRAITSTGSTM